MAVAKKIGWFVGKVSVSDKSQVVLRGEEKEKNHRLKVYRDPMGSMGRFVYENLHEWLIFYGKCR